MPPKATPLKEGPVSTPTESKVFQRHKPEHEEHRKNMLPFGQERNNKEEMEMSNKEAFPTAAPVEDSGNGQEISGKDEVTDEEIKRVGSVSENDREGKETVTSPSVSPIPEPAESVSVEPIPEYVESYSEPMLESHESVDLILEPDEEIPESLEPIPEFVDPILDPVKETPESVDTMQESLPPKWEPTPQSINPMKETFEPISESVLPTMDSTEPIKESVPLNMESVPLLLDSFWPISESVGSKVKPVLPILTPDESVQELDALRPKHMALMPELEKAIEEKSSEEEGNKEEADKVHHKTSKGEGEGRDEKHLRK
ncbi:uncharacterized protein [Misgurnus anguillicaudatus]|uniref:uncharacterized protein n=1 Tax=Misgurnus anguillicaudatus TaxID=75329 RepID=UPI003CCF68D4